MENSQFGNGHLFYTYIAISSVTKKLEINYFITKYTRSLSNSILNFSGSVFFLPNQWFGFHFAVFKLSILILLNYAKYDIDLCHLNVRIMLHNPEAAGRTTQAGSFSSSS